MAYATRSQLTAALALRERDHALPGGQVVRIRELTAQQRLDAQDAERALYEAHGQRYTDVSQATFWAYVVVAGVLDEPGGRPLYREDDVPALVAGRRDVLADLGVAIWAWSDADRGSLRAGDPAADGGQLDAGGGAEGADGAP